MRTYGKIESGFWQNAMARGLSDEAKLLLIYAKSCHHGNAIGCFVLPLGYIMADLGWASERVSEGLSELVSKGILERDEASSLTRIVDWWANNTVENMNVAKSVVKVIAALPKNRVLANAINEMNALPNEFLKGLRNVFRNVLPNEYRNPEPEPEPEPEPSPTRGAGSAAVTAANIGMIETFDFATVLTYGKEHTRQHYAETDAAYADRWIAAQLPLEMACEVLLVLQLSRKKAALPPLMSLEEADGPMMDALTGKWPRHDNHTRAA
jgi:hypothetical protein